MVRRRQARPHCDQDQAGRQDLGLVQGPEQPDDGLFVPAERRKEHQRFQGRRQRFPEVLNRQPGHVCEPVLEERGSWDGADFGRGCGVFNFEVPGCCQVCLRLVRFES